MTADHLMLLCLLFVPLAGSVVVALLGPRRDDVVRWVSLAAAVVTLLLALTLAGRFMSLGRPMPPLADAAGKAPLPTFRPAFVPGSTESQPYTTTWEVLRIGPAAVQFYIGLDGLNVWLVVLTAVLMLPSVLVSWNHIQERVHEFYAWLLALQTCMMGVFLAFDILFFYFFFELSLVPLFFLIGIWGGPERRYAARKFFIYTLAGSLLTLLGVLGVVLACYNKSDGELTFSIPRLVAIVQERLALQSSEE